ncbi:MAG: DUF1638 domain-containing protein [Gammaproteobacteria bacterium]|nr:DUF1638 domain-containing protein [Gammaproteobacteria bacterium]
MRNPVLLIACGAIAREISQLCRQPGWSHLSLRCLDAALHNHPERIVPALEQMILAQRAHFDRIFVAYADCGTGGAIDRLLERHRIARLPGAHCYEFLAGSTSFHALADAEPGSFYLTDFLARHFDRLVREGLGLDRYPQLLPQYFGNYRRLVYLAQTEDPALDRLAEQHASFLGLAYERHFTGLAHLRHAVGEQVMQWQN